MFLGYQAGVLDLSNWVAASIQYVTSPISDGLTVEDPPWHAVFEADAARNRLTT